MDKISIIVPIYNREKCLKYCIESLINQTYENLEIVLVNDGSTDSSGEICDLYAKQDKRIKVIHKKNNGVSEARNTGIYSASGKYILFVDSDDCVRENYVSEFIKAKEKYPDCKNIWCGFEMRRTYDDMSLSEYKIDKTDDGYYSFSRKQMATLASKMLTPMIWNKLFDREIIVDNLLKMDNAISLGEDLIFSLDYIDKTENEEIIYINKPLYIYMVADGDTLNTKYHKNRIEISYKINNTLESYYKKWNLNEEEMEKFHASAFFRYENTMISVMSKANDDSFLLKLKKCREILKSEEFINALKRSPYKPKLPFRICYKLKIYLPVFILNKLIAALKK